MIAIGETHLKPSQHFSLGNFVPIRKDRTEKRGNRRSCRYYISPPPVNPPIYSDGEISHSVGEISHYIGDFSNIE